MLFSYLVRNRYPVSGHGSGSAALLAPNRTPFLRPPIPSQRRPIPVAAAPQADSPLRRIAFNLALVFVFLRFSLIHEMLSLIIGFDPHIVTVVGVPLVILTVASGGIGRTFRGRPALYWLGFAFWLLAATPFSSWVGESITNVTGFLKVEFPMLFIIGGLVVTWRECKLMMWATALAAFANVATARLFERTDGTRLQLETGSIGNSNDFVAHILMVLPFVLFVLLTVKRSWWIRCLCIAVMAYGVYLASLAESRGGLVTFAVMCLVLLARASWAQRLWAGAAVTLLVIVILSVLPSSAKARYATLFVGETGDSEAVDSTRDRAYLLQTSIKFTLEHPIFGVGPGEFLNFEGSTAIKNGQLGSWHVPHNSYTQVSSEDGIPALLFLIASSVSEYLILRRVLLKTRNRPDCRAIATAASCLQISLIGFSCSILFLSLVYNFYLPALGGFAIALQNAADHELSTGLPVAAA